MQVDVLSGPERRRRWSEDQKRAIVAAAFAPGAVVTEVARRADLCTSLIYRWRREFGSGRREFSEVIVGPPDVHDRTLSIEPSSGDAAGSTLGASVGDRPSAIEVTVDGRARVTIAASVSPALASAVITALIRR